MDEPAPFASMILSRPARRPALRRGFMIGLALALHTMILGAVLIAPFLTLEMMTAPKAGVTQPIPIFQPSMRDHGAHGGDRLPAPASPKGDGRARPRAQPRAAATIVPAEAPPVDNLVDDDAAARVPGVPGDPNGDGNDATLTPGGCQGCVGEGGDGGPRTPGDRDEPLDATTPGLTPPELIPASRALPKYPDLARRARVEGSVILMIDIDAEGRVGEVEVIRSADQRWGFDLSAIEAVKQWRYHPASMHGRAVAVHAQVIVEFSLSR